MHKDKLGQIIYVGKAVSLKNRVRQYFQSSKNMDAKVRSMVSHIEEFEYITTGSEMEALILECNLIKKHRPKYNVLLRDDKTYPYIKITTNEEYPRIIKTRTVKKDGAKYFGPYSDVGAVNQIIDVLNSAYSLKRCPLQRFPKSHKPCLNYHIHQCGGVCMGEVSKSEYMGKIDLAIDFLKGKNKELESYLKQKMERASQNLDFERAAEYRDYILAIGALTEKQRVVLQGALDIDLIMTVGGAKDRYIVLFFIRGGKLSGRETYELQHTDEDTSEELVSAFMKQHYSDGMNIPKEIIVDTLPDDSRLIEEYLSTLCGRQVKIIVPKRGEKKALLSLAKKDVTEMTKTIDQRAENKKKRELAVGSQIYQILGSMGYESGDAYSGRIYRAEAYDISNTNGVDTVGAMVVFEGLAPKKKAYRRFKVCTVEGPNDYGSMQEILVRRLQRAIESDPGFKELPDLMLIDGGKGHVTAALAAVSAMGFDIPVIGMAKDDHHRTKELVYFKDGELVQQELKQLPLLYKYIGNIQEEVHRFAIDYHRKLRGKNMMTSILDEIDGIGPTKRNALLEHFGSIENIKKADKEQLTRVKGITPKLAQKIQDYLKGRKERADQ